MSSTHDGSFERSRSSAAEPVPSAPFSESRPVNTHADARPRHRSVSDVAPVNTLPSVAPGAVKPCIRLFADEVVIHRTEGLGSVFETEKMPLLGIPVSVKECCHVRSSYSTAGCMYFAKNTGKLAEDGTLHARATSTAIPTPRPTATDTGMG